MLPQIVCTHTICNLWHTLLQVVCTNTICRMLQMLSRRDDLWYVAYFARSCLHVHDFSLRHFFCRKSFARDTICSMRHILLQVVYTKTICSVLWILSQVFCTDTIRSMRYVLQGAVWTGTIRSKRPFWSNVGFCTDAICSMPHILAQVVWTNWFVAWSSVRRRSFRKRAPLR